MDLFLGLIVGVVYGRNARHINERVYADACKVADVLSRSQMGITAFFVLETIVRALERQQVVCMQSIMCECNRRSCAGRTVSVNTYVRKLKAVQQ